MRIDVSFKHMEKSSVLEDIIEKDISKVRRRLKIFKSDDPIHLSLHIEKNPHRDEYFTWINLYLPFKVIKAQRKSDSASVAINECFSALLKQLDKFKHKLERHLRKK